jgi:hypothetical protein
MRKIIYLISSILALILLAMAFQNFSLQPQPMEISKDQDEMFADLAKAVKSSDDDHAEKRAAINEQEATSSGGRAINSIQHDPGEVYEGGPVSVDLSDESLKQ